MSAAEPAVPHTPDPAVNGGEGAAVIPLDARRVRRQGPRSRRGEDSMGTPPTPPQGPADRETVLERLAEDMELAFAEIRRTLTDSETALVFLHTLRLVDRALTGAVVSGIISEEQRAELAVLFGGMAEAPRLV